MNYVRTPGGLYVPPGASRGTGRFELPPASVGAPIQLPTWAPTTEAEANAWLDEQLDIWNRPDVRAAISDTAGRIEAELELRDTAGAAMNLSGATMDQAAGAAWMADELRTNGFPRDAEAAAAMTLRFLDAQAARMGFHPGVIGAVDLISNWPESPEAATEWGYQLGANITAQYGVMLPTTWDAQGVVIAAASTACLQLGVPFVGTAVVSIEAMWDGKLSNDELRGIVVSVGATISTVIGQIYGIPAPVGAFLGAIHTMITYDILQGIFGWDVESEEDKRGKAWMAMQRARAAQMQQCHDVALNVWRDYNDYWNDTVSKLDTALQAQAEMLGDGLRYFGGFALREVEDADGNAVPLPRPIKHSCANYSGCLYFGSYEESQNISGFVRSPPATGQYTPAWGSGITDMPGSITPVANWPGARRPDGSIDVYEALRFYGATRYVTPYQPLVEYYGYGNSLLFPNTESLCWESRFKAVRCWGAMLHTDEEYLQEISFIQTAPSPDDLEDCMVPVWAEYMMATVIQLGPAAALVVADAARTVAVVSAEAATTAEIARAYAQAQKKSDAILWQYETTRQLTRKVAMQRREVLRQRRQKRSAEARFNYGLLAAGVGSLAGGLVAEILGKRRR